VIVSKNNQCFGMGVSHGDNTSLVGGGGGRSRTARCGAAALAAVVAAGMIAGAALAGDRPDLDTGSLDPCDATNTEPTISAISTSVIVECGGTYGDTEAHGIEVEGPGVPITITYSGSTTTLGPT